MTTLPGPWSPPAPAPATAPPPRRLLDRVRDAVRARHYSIRTEEAYAGWIRRYILFHVRDAKGAKDRPLPLPQVAGPLLAAWLSQVGIARALAAVAAGWARSLGCAEFASDALLDNETSHARHKALGFQETERVVFFRKQLSS